MCHQNDNKVDFKEITNRVLKKIAKQQEEQEKDNLMFYSMEDEEYGENEIDYDEEKDYSNFYSMKDEYLDIDKYFDVDTINYEEDDN